MFMKSSVVLLSTFACVVSALGSIFWASEPVYGGQTLLLTGGPWTSKSNLSLQVQVLSDSLPINAGPVFSQPLISATNYSLTYVIPSSLSPGVYSYRLVNSDNSPFTDWKLLNAPKVWFVQGDLTKTASQGGWIGVYGTSLLIPNDPTSLPPSANLVSVANATVSFNLGVSLQKRGNAWVQYFEVPAYIPVGEYFLSVHNGAGGPTAWVQYRSEIGPQILNTIVVQASPYSLWPSTVFDVTKSTGTNLATKLTNTLNSLKTNKGGILYFPTGNYFFTSPFTLPPNTILRGDGTDKTFFSYNSTSYGSFITGTVFGVENVTLSATITNPKNSCGCILISKSKTKSDVSWVKNTNLYCPDPNGIPSATRSCNVSGYNHQISIDQSERMVIENVKFDDCDNCVGITGNSNYTRITNGNMTFRTQNVVIRCGMNHVTENLERLYLGDHVANGFGATAGVQPGFLIGEYCPTSMTRDVYYGNSTSKGQKGVWNDDTVADGKEGWYYGGVASVAGNVTTLSSPLRWANFSAMNAVIITPTFDFSLLTGSIVMVVGGKGMGQYRFLAGVITDYSTWSISLSSPWDVEPDSTSTITITKMKGRILGIGNNFGSEGIHMWSWFASADVIYAENTFGANFTDYTQTYHLDWQMPPGTPTQLSFTGGFRYPNAATDPNLFAGYHSGVWYNQVLGNTVAANTAGLGILWLTSGMPSKPGVQWSGEVCFGSVIRGNTNPANATFQLSFADYTGALVVEGNTNVTSVQLSKNKNYILFRNNVWAKNQNFAECTNGAWTNLTVAGTQCGNLITIV